MLGFPISIGQADFYPNGGGMFQPECELSTLTENKLIELAGLGIFKPSKTNPKI